jgi:hypothetical protein
MSKRNSIPETGTKPGGPELIEEIEDLIEDYEYIDRGERKEVELGDKKAVFEKPEEDYESPVYLFKTPTNENLVDLGSMKASEHAEVLLEYLEMSDSLELTVTEEGKSETVNGCERDLKELRDEDGISPGEERVIEFENGKAVFVCLEDPLYMVETLTWRGRIELDKGSTKSIADTIRGVIGDSQSLEGDIVEKREEDLAECEKKLRELRDKEASMMEGEEERVEFENGEVRFTKTEGSSLKDCQVLGRGEEKHPNFLAEMPGCPQGLYLNLRLGDIRRHANVIRSVLAENMELELNV